MMWLLTFMSLIGVVLNIKKKKVCFIVWGVSNAMWAVIDFEAGLPAQGMLFIAYFCLSIWGLVEWSKEGMKGW